MDICRQHAYMGHPVSRADISLLQFVVPSTDDVSAELAYLYNLDVPNNTLPGYAAVSLQLNLQWSQEACIARVNLGHDLRTCCVRS
jgi:hypothetical protein